MRFLLKTLGCRTNLSESEALSLELTKRGHRYSVTKPDLIVVNGCTVTAVADRKTRQTLTAFKNKFPEARLVLIGCSARNETLSWPGVECFKNVEDLLETVPQRKANGEKRKASSLKTRAHLKIQEGCNNRCTYCIISEVRGPERSVSAQEILKNCKEAEKRGVREIVLAGTHIANWGKDGKPREKLSDLIKLILRETKIPILRLSSLEPQDFDPDFAKLFHEKRIAPYLHLALQSGSNKILGMMERKYKAADVLKLIKSLRKIRPEIFLGADLIVGFPGETLKDFEKTMKFCRELGLCSLHVFPYSERPGTPASGFLKQVSIVERRRRAAKLRALSDNLLTSYAQKFVGKRMQVLVEESYKGRRMATTPNFLKVSLPCEQVFETGTLLVLRISKWDRKLKALQIDKSDSHS